MDISLISITPITGNDEEQLAVRLTEDGHSILLDVELVFGLAEWLQEQFGTDDSGDGEVLDGPFEEPEDVQIDIPEEALVPFRPQTSRAHRQVDIEALVTDGGSGPMRVVKSPRPVL